MLRNRPIRNRLLYEHDIGVVLIFSQAPQTSREHKRLNFTPVAYATRLANFAAIRVASISDSGSAWPRPAIS